MIIIYVVIPETDRQTQAEGASEETQGGRITASYVRNGHEFRKRVKNYVGVWKRDVGMTEFRGFCLEVSKTENGVLFMRCPYHVQFLLKYRLSIRVPEKSEIINVGLQEQQLRTLFPSRGTASLRVQAFGTAGGHTNLEEQ